MSGFNVPPEANLKLIIIPFVAAQKAFLRQNVNKIISDQVSRYSEGGERERERERERVAGGTTGNL